jgi:hypothetical protein
MDGAPFGLGGGWENRQRQQQKNDGRFGYWMVRLMVEVWMVEPPLAVTVTA